MALRTCLVFYLGLTLATGQIIFSDSRSACQRELPNFCDCGHIQIVCDCRGQSLEMNKKFEARREVSLSNCGDVTVVPHLLFPFTLTVHNTRNLTLNPASFVPHSHQRPHITLSVVNSMVNFISEEIIDPEGRVIVGPKRPKDATLTLIMKNCTVNDLESNTFGSFMLKDIAIDNSTIASVSQLSIDNVIDGTFEIINTKFGPMESNAITLRRHSRSNHQVTFKLENNMFAELQDTSIHGTIAGDAMITNNTFPYLSAPPFQLSVDGHAIISRNTFPNIPSEGLRFTVKERLSLIKNDIDVLEGGALLGIVPSEIDSIIIIGGNLLREPQPTSLCLHEAFRDVVIKDNVFNRQCSCNITSIVSVGLGMEGNTSIQELNQDRVHQQWIQHGSCLDRGGGKHVRIEYFLFQACFNKTKLTTVMLVIFAILLIVISFCVIIAWRRLKHKGALSQNSSDYQSFSVPAPPSTAGPWSLVSPDPKMYQETEIHVVFDNVQEMDELPSSHKQRDSCRKDSYPSKDSSSLISKDSSSKMQLQRLKELSNSEKGPPERQSCPALTLPD